LIPRCIDTTHSIAISKIADRIEFEARAGARIRDVLHVGHIESAFFCMHVGREAMKTLKPPLPDPFVVLWPTPFGHCSDRDVASELQLRQILARDRLTGAREKGWILEHLKVWE
jgi:hypothetical protein